MPKIQLPDGCKGLDMADGTKYTGKPGDKVEVSENHAKYIKTSYYGQSGIMAPSEQMSFGTKKTMICKPCHGRRWNAWNDTCPKCGTPTVEEIAE